MSNFSQAPRSAAPANLATAALEQRIAELEAKVRRLESCLTVTPGGDLNIHAPSIKIVAGSRCEVRAAQLDIPATNVSIAAQVVKLASGMLTLTAPLSNFSGLVKCDVIQANTVIGASYTPGAGNVW